MARARYELRGKVVLITGAARGIGAETARRAARKGARVSLVGLEGELLERVAAECGPESTWFEADVTDVDALARAVDGTVERLGGIDVAMANAGVAIGGASLHVDLEQMERLLQINLVGVVRTLKLCLPHVIERRGYLLPVASVAAIAHVPGIAAYSASKAGVEAFADALRMEVKHHGVGVGVAYYSWIDTDMVRAAEDRSDFSRMRGELKGPFGKTYPLAKAADATIRGIERRVRWLAYPSWVKAMIIGRGIAPLLAESQVGDRMAEVERLTGEAVARLGEEASEPVGAGGRAASRSADAR